MLRQDTEDLSKKSVEEELTFDLLLEQITLNEIQKYALIIFYILDTIVIFGILEFTKGFRSPHVAGVHALDLSSNIQDILLFLQLAFILSAVFFIYDILHDNFFQNLKNQIPIMLIISSLLALVPSFLIYFEVKSNNNKIVYLGVEPEVLIAAIMFSFFLFYSPPIFIIKYYKKYYSSLKSIQSSV